MFILFIVLLNLTKSLVRNRAKCLFLNDESCMFRPTPFDMNLVELKYYPFMICLNKYTGLCNALSPKICVPKEKNR